MDPCPPFGVRAVGFFFPSRATAPPFFAPTNMFGRMFGAAPPRSGAPLTPGPQHSSSSQSMMQQAPLLDVSPHLIETLPSRCRPKYSCCCTVLTVLTALLVGAVSGGGLVATVLLQLAARPVPPDLPPASTCCTTTTAAGLTGHFVGNVSATKTVLWPCRLGGKTPASASCMDGPALALLRAA